MRFFRDRRFTGATLVGFLINMTLYGALFVLGLYFQVTRHWPAWVSGIAFLPLPVVLGIANMPASRIADRLGPGGCMSTGLLIAASQAGGAIGVAVFGALPIHPAFLLGSGLMVAASATAACLIRSAKPAQQTGHTAAGGRSLIR